MSHTHIYASFSEIVTLQMSVMIMRVTVRSHNAWFLRTQGRETYLSVAETRDATREC